MHNDKKLMDKNPTLGTVTLLGMLMLFCTSAVAENSSTKMYSPNVQRDIPDQLLWGDTHLHTSFSTDAGMIGTTLGPNDAYRFAKGEVVTSTSGQRVKLLRPLDFLVVADHAENLGLPVLLTEGNKTLLNTEFGKLLHGLSAQGKGIEAYKAWGGAQAKGQDPIGNRELDAIMWQRSLDISESHNQPGRFTALLGYEWTSSIDANNLHRVVLFRDNEDRVSQVAPFSNFDSSDPEQLWQWMAAYEQKTGGEILAIPHNGNLSNGLMFAAETFDGRPIDRAYAEKRMRWEPLYEVTQMKGDAETHPSLSPDDEFADYETWDKGNFGTYGKKPEMLSQEYARSALKLGLEQEAKLGVNPFKFGLIGSTDAHTGLPTTEEDNFFGKINLGEPGLPTRMSLPITGVVPSKDGADVVIRHWQASSSGLAAVWAKENTREAIFDALKRKEVYATTGTRIKVRMFAGWDFQKEDAFASDIAALGYETGVPMGGDLSVAPEGAAPQLLIQAARDPDGANLDRLQVVKGWRDTAGELHEKVYNVAVSAPRVIGEDGRVEPVGNTVDLERASYDNSIGAPELVTVWRDPDFDPAERAFYYVRVLEIPTPRWTAYDRVRLSSEAPAQDSQITQERAYTSPVWYTP